MEGPPLSPQSSVSSSSAARPLLSPFEARHDEYHESPSICWYCSQTFGNRYAFAGHHNAHTMSKKRSANIMVDPSNIAQQQPGMAMLDPPTGGDLPPFRSTCCIYKPPQGYRRGVARGLLQQIRSAPRYSYRPSIRSIVRSAIPRPTLAGGVNIPTPPKPNPGNFTESVLFPSPRLLATVPNCVMHPPTLPDVHDREGERAVECTLYEPKVIINKNAPLVIGSVLTTGNFIAPPDVHGRKGKRDTEDILYESRGMSRNAPLGINSGSIATTGSFVALHEKDKNCVVVKDFASPMKPYLDRESMRHLLVAEHGGGYKEANLLQPTAMGGPTILVETYCGFGEDEEAKAKGLDLSLHL